MPFLTNSPKDCSILNWWRNFKCGYKHHAWLKITIVRGCLTTFILMIFTDFFSPPQPVEVAEYQYQIGDGAVIIFSKGNICENLKR